MVNKIWLSRETGLMDSNVAMAMTIGLPTGIAVGVFVAMLAATHIPTIGALILLLLTSVMIGTGAVFIVKFLYEKELVERLKVIPGFMPFGSDTYTAYKIDTSNLPGNTILGAIYLNELLTRGISGIYLVSKSKDETDGLFVVVSSIPEDSIIKIAATKML